MTRPYLVLFLIGFMVCHASSAPAFDETLEVHSRTIPDIELLRGKASAGSPVTLSGELSGPDAQEKLPVVILLHGGTGRIAEQFEIWGRYLNGKGIATLSLDSYSARGFSSIHH